MNGKPLLWVVLLLLAGGQLWTVYRIESGRPGPAPSPAIDFAALAKQAKAREAQSEGAAWLAVSVGLQAGGKLADLVPAAESAIEGGRKKAKAALLAALAQLTPDSKEPTPEERAELVRATAEIGKTIGGGK